MTRWREDATSDCWGQFFCIRDLEWRGAWSAGRQPLGGDPDNYQALLGSDRAVFQRRDGEIETRTVVRTARGRSTRTAVGRIPIDSRPTGPSQPARRRIVRPASAPRPIGARWINSIATPLPARKVRNAPATMATTAAGAVRREPAAIAVAAPRVAAADAGGDGHFERPGPVTTRFAVPGTRCQIALSSQLLTALTRR